MRSLSGSQLGAHYGDVAAPTGERSLGGSISDDGLGESSFDDGNYSGVDDELEGKVGLWIQKGSKEKKTAGILRQWCRE